MAELGAETVAAEPEAGSEARHIRSGYRRTFRV